MAVCPTGFASTPSRVLKVEIPIGGILIWSGAIVDIPGNFAICDGNNGTPNLIDNFIVGAGNDHAVNDTGGNVDHNHQAGGVTNTADAGPGIAWDATPNSTTESNLPPFYALAYIMRIT